MAAAAALAMPFGAEAAGMSQEIPHDAAASAARRRCRRSGAGRRPARGHDQGLRPFPCRHPAHPLARAARRERRSFRSSASASRPALRSVQTGRRRTAILWSTGSGRGRTASRSAARRCCMAGRADFGATRTAPRGARGMNILLCMETPAEKGARDLLRTPRTEPVGPCWGAC